MSTDIITEHLDLWTSAVTYNNGKGRGNNGEPQLIGIQKLRELILELAVRGKLVPQDPEDEPASKLLERIEAEKARLYKEGKIKKPKKLSTISEEEKPFNLPKGWEWTRLEKIAQINPRNHADDSLEVGFIPMPLIGTGHKGEHSLETREWVQVKKGYTHFADGDIALAKITPCFENSKAVVFSGLTNGVGAGTTELHVARPYSELINPYFVLLNLKSPLFIELGKSEMTGSAGQKRLPKEYFANTPIPLPPYKEQVRIVEKVDELMALCDRLEQQTSDQISAHETLVDTLLDTLTRSRDAAVLADNWARLAAHFDTLFTTEHSIDRLEQTILQLAVMGRLVPQDPNDEPASKLLERIQSEQEKSVKEGKEKKLKRKSPNPNFEDRFGLPDGWEFKWFIELLDFQGGGQPPKSKFSYRQKEGFVQLIQIRDLGESPQPVFVPQNSVSKFCSEQDILIGRYGASVGKVFWGKEGAYNVALIKLLNEQGCYNQKFLYYLMKSPLGQSLFVGISRSAQDGFKKSDIAYRLLPLPPINEQKRIVEKVEALLSLCDRLKSHLDEASATQYRLAESIVKQAVA